MKAKKIISLFAAAAMTAAMAVPFTASAEEIENVVFQSDENTEWILWEPNGAKDGLTATVGENTLTTRGNTAVGESVAPTISNSANSGSPVQVRPVFSSDIILTSGTTYTVSVDYTATISEFTNASTQDTVYMQYRYGSAATTKTTAVRGKSGDTPQETYTGTLTGTLTPAEDGAPEIQLYLRHCLGTVTFSNVRITAPITEVPAEAVAETNGRYFTTLPEAVAAAQSGGTVTLLQDVTLDSRLTIGKNITITSDNKTISGADPDHANMIIVKSDVTFDKTNVTSTDGNAIGVEATGSKLTFKNGTITGTLSHNNGENTSITLDNATVDTITTRAGREAAVSSSNCTLSITNSTITSLVYNSEKDSYTADASSTITTTTDSANPAPSFTMSSEYISSYKGDEDESTAVAYKATFTGSGSFNTKDVTWTLGEDTLKLAEASSAGINIDLNGGSVTWGIIIEGVYYDSPDSTPALSTSITTNN